MKIAPADFQYIQTLARDSAAIVIEEDKTYLVESRLEPLAVKLGLPDIAALVAKARIGGPTFQKRIIEALTIHETYFFRDFKPFEAIKKFILPAIISSSPVDKTFNVWSAACSSGQEPYSVAMMARECFNLNEWKIRIIATDISEAILDKAKQGVYSQLEMGRGLAAAYQDKYFTKIDDGWKVNDKVRSMVEFKSINLSKDWPLFPQMDIILLRNVMIYFDNETKKQILAKIHRLLKPGGILFLGSTESPIFLDSNFLAQEADQAVYYISTKGS
ncbi:MAG: CheR family methyltransferase [Verrucomicrobiota bacterium]